MSNEYVLITTLSHFKLKYAMPAEDFKKLGFSDPVDQTKLAELINQGRLKEFSQTHLGEVVSEVSVLNESDILTVFDAENDYLKAWSQDKKLEYIKNWSEDA